MRMRYKPYARAELAAWPLHVNTPAQLRAHWAGFFAEPSLPLHVELGCGKGGFLAAAALRNTACNHLGIDIKSEVLVVAKRTVEREFSAAARPPVNIAIAAYNIEYIGQILAPEDAVARLYINFCNPWYKSGHAKHRLTHPRQLVQYREFLRPGAEIWFKTDDDPLFNDSLRYFSMCGFDVPWLHRDLHTEEPPWNIRTEHEQMFAQEGRPIKACVATMRPARLDTAALRRLKTV